mmetsp:Transcript_14100/g.26358  ORF Transcript_14100/g.26358 Transcript_14100/m.26358 type:complete len:195 (+) Transcript_14100:48-632(+)
MSVTQAGSAPSVYFFGLPGAGKTHCGEVLKQSFGYDFHDADGWLPQDLKDSLSRGKGFTEEQRDRYAEEISKRISEVKQSEARLAREENRPARPLAIAQATFKQRHRDLIRRVHPDLVFVWVQANENSRVRRLRDREGVVDVALGCRMARDFEAPSQEPHVVLVNDMDDEPIETAFMKMLREAMTSCMVEVTAS